MASNREIFRPLQKEWPGEFFYEVDGDDGDVDVSVDEKIAEGGQAQIYEASAPSYLLWCSSGSNQGGMATPRPAEAMASGDIEANQTRREFCNLSFCMSSVLCNILEDWKVCGEVWI